MTTNAFLFVWCSNGIESIIPITQYDQLDKENTMRILKDETPIVNPIDGIIRNLLLRATLNSHRNYEIYAIDCDESMDINFWNNQWNKFPQGTAEVVRERGQCLFSNWAEH